MMTLDREVPIGAKELSQITGYGQRTVDMWRLRQLLPERDWTVGGRACWTLGTIVDWLQATDRWPTRAMVHWLRSTDLPVCQEVERWTAVLGTPMVATLSTARLIGRHPTWTGCLDLTELGDAVSLAAGRALGTRGTGSEVPEPEWQQLRAQLAGIMQATADRTG